MRANGSAVQDISSIHKAPGKGIERKGAAARPAVFLRQIARLLACVFSRSPKYKKATRPCGGVAFGKHLAMPWSHYSTFISFSRLSALSTCFMFHSM